MKRKRKLLFGLLCLTLCTLIGLTRSVHVSASSVSAEITPRIFLPLVSGQLNLQPPAVSLFGASDSNSFTMSRSPQGMTLAATAGMSGVRTSVAWAAIEPVKTSPPQFHWQSADAALVPLLQQGFSPQVLILANPTWAASTPCGPLYDPNYIADFVAGLGARYPQVKYWGLYNEVDLTTYSNHHSHNGGCFGEPDLDQNGKPDYADYAELMRVAWRALHGANPEAKLAFGLLAHDNFDPRDSPPGYPGGCCFAYSFADNLFAYMQAHPLPAGEQYGDILGFNNYMIYDRAFWEHYYPGDGISSKANSLQMRMSQYGLAFPMLTSEISATSTHPDFPFSFVQQARDLALLYIQSAASGLEQSIWWTFADMPSTCSNAELVAAHPTLARIAKARVPENLWLLPEKPPSADSCATWTFGIVDEHLKPKPSFFAFKTVQEQLGGWTFSKVVNKNGLFMYVFTRDGKQKRVYYVKDGAVRTLHLKAKRAVHVNVYGTQAVLKPNAQGKVTFSVGLEPVYLELVR